jgi:hypothetical protein
MLQGPQSPITRGGVAVRDVQSPTQRMADASRPARRRYQEARRIGDVLQRNGSHLLGTSVRMDVGIAGADYDNQEAHATYPLGLPSPQWASLPLHRLCFEKGLPCGFVQDEDDLSRLKVFFVPHWVIWKDEWTERVERFAQAPLLPQVPAGLEVTLREGDGRRLLFVLNSQAEPVLVPEVPAGLELMGDRPHAAGLLTLAAYGCAAIQPSPTRTLRVLREVPGDGCSNRSRHAWLPLRRPWRWALVPV